MEEIMHNAFKNLVLSYTDGKFTKLACSWVPYTDPKSKYI